MYFPLDGVSSGSSVRPNRSAVPRGRRSGTSPARNGHTGSTHHPVDDGPGLFILRQISSIAAHIPMSFHALREYPEPLSLSVASVRKPGVR